MASGNNLFHLLVDQINGRKHYERHIEKGTFVGDVLPCFVVSGVAVLGRPSIVNGRTFNAGDPVTSRAG